MKKLFQLFFSFVVTMFVFSSCNKIDDVLPNRHAVAANPDNIPGTWRVERYTDGLSNDTYQFEGLLLNFLPDGVFQVTTDPGGTVAATGTWRLSDGNRVMIIRIQGYPNVGDSYIADLNNEWEIVRTNQTELWLLDSYAIPTKNEKFKLARVR